jgi:hypothetical protein
MVIIPQFACIVGLSMFALYGKVYFGPNIFASIEVFKPDGAIKATWG